MLSLNKEIASMAEQQKESAKLIPELSTNFKQTISNITTKLEAIRTETNKSLHDPNPTVTQKFEKEIHHLAEEIIDLKVSQRKNHTTLPPKVPDEIKIDLANLTNEIRGIKKRQIPTPHRHHTTPRLNALQHQITNLVNQISNLRQQVSTKIVHPRTTRRPSAKRRITNFMQSEISEITNDIKELGGGVRRRTTHTPHRRTGTHRISANPMQDEISDLTNDIKALGPRKRHRRTTPRITRRRTTRQHPTEMLQNQILNLVKEVKKLKNSRIDDGEFLPSEHPISRHLQKLALNITNEIHHLQEERMADKKNNTAEHLISHELQDKINNLADTVGRIEHHVINHQPIPTIADSNSLQKQMLNLSRQIEHLEKRQLMRSPLPPSQRRQRTAKIRTTTTLSPISGKLQQWLSNITDEMKKIEKDQEITKMRVLKPTPASLSIKFEQLFKNLTNEIHTIKERPTPAHRQITTKTQPPFSRELTNSIHNLTEKVRSMEKEQKRFEISTQTKDTPLSDKLQQWFTNITKEMQTLENKTAPTKRERRHSTRNIVEVEIRNLTRHLQIIENKVKQPPRPTRPPPILRKLQAEFLNLTHNVNTFQNEEQLEKRKDREKLDVTTKLQNEIANLTKGIEKVEEERLHDFNQTTKKPQFDKEINLLVSNFTKQMHTMEQQRLQREKIPKPVPPIPKFVQDEIRNLTRGISSLEEQQHKLLKKTTPHPTRAGIVQIELKNLTKEIKKIEEDEVRRNRKPVPVPTIPHRFEKELTNLTIEMKKIEQHELNVEKKHSAPTNTSKLEKVIEQVVKEVHTIEKNQSEWIHRKPTKTVINTTKHRNLAAALALKLNFNPARNDVTRPTVTSTIKRTVTHEQEMSPGSLPDIGFNRDLKHDAPTDISNKLPSDSPTPTPLTKPTITQHRTIHIHQNHVPHLENDTEYQHEKDISLHAEVLSLIPEQSSETNNDELSKLGIDKGTLMALLGSRGSDNGNSSQENFTIPTSGKIQLKTNSPVNLIIKNREAPSVEDIRGIEAARKRFNKNRPTRTRAGSHEPIIFLPTFSPVPRKYNAFNTDSEGSGMALEKKDQVPEKPLPTVRHRRRKGRKIHRNSLRASISGK